MACLLSSDTQFAPATVRPALSMLNLRYDIQKYHSRCIIQLSQEAFRQVTKVALISA